MVARVARIRGNRLQVVADELPENLSCVAYPPLHQNTTQDERAGADECRYSVATSRRHVGDSMERLTVAQAAERLGVTRDAVRKRIKRHSIEWEVGENGETYVYVDPSATAEDPSGDTSGQEQVVEVLRDQVEHLREQLDRAEERDRENRRIIAALTQRIPELEAPSEPRESPETPSEEYYGTSPEEAEDSLQRRSERSWWRRFFGLE